MKSREEFLRSLPPPSEVHVAAITQAVSALLPQIAASELSYVHRHEICQHLQNVVYAVSRGRWTTDSL